MKIDKKFNEFRESYISDLEEAKQYLTDKFFKEDSFNNDSEDAKENLKYELSSKSFYDSNKSNYFRILKEFDIDKNQVRLTPEYVRYAIEQFKKIKPTMYNTFVNGVFKFEDLEKFVPEIFQIWNRYKNKLTTKSQGYIQVVLKIVKNAIDKAFSYYLPKEAPTPRPRLPMEDKLNAICEELGISLEDAYREMQNESRDKRTITPSHILYFMTKAMAKVSAKKNPPVVYPSDGGGHAHWEKPQANSAWYHMRWNAILRKLGYAGVVDTKHKGYVHGGEPTQGAFVNPKLIEIVHIIHNRAGDYRNPKFQNWGSHKHTDSYEPIENKNPTYSGTPEEKKTQAFKKRIQKSQNNFLSPLAEVNSALFHNGSEDYYILKAYKEGVNFLNEITRFKIIFNKQIQEDKIKYEEKLKNNNGDSYYANSYLTDNSPFKILNSMKTNVYKRLNGLFKNANYKGDEHWVKVFKEIAKELDRPDVILNKNKILPLKDQIRLTTKEDKPNENEKINLVEIPLPPKPEDANLENDYNYLRKVVRQTKNALNSISENVGYGHSYEAKNVNVYMLESINLYYKIMSYYKEELAKQKESYKKAYEQGENEDYDNYRYWYEILSVFSDLDYIIGNLRQKSKKENWKAWYQLASILYEISSNVENSAKEVQIKLEPEPTEELVKPNKYRDDEDGEKFKYGDEEPNKETSSEPSPPT